MRLSRGLMGIGVAAALALPGTATAATPEITSVEPAPDSTTISWSVPPGEGTHSIEVADSPEVTPAGSFLDQNLVSRVLLFGRPELSWKLHIPAGTYYVHVASWGAAPCTSPLSPDCVKNFSAAVQVTVPVGPPPPPQEASMKMTSVGLNRRHVIATWTVASWLRADLVEVADSPETYTAGPDAGAFVDENVVTREDAAHTAPNPYNYGNPIFTTRASLAGGQYWVHVSAVDATACTQTRSTCSHYFSDAMPLTVIYYPPELATLGRSGHRVNATWVIADGMESDLIEVATAPQVYPAGPDRGAFLAESTVISEFLDPDQTGWSAPIDLPSGTYYVHVGDISPVACFDPNAATCLDEFSAAHIVVIPEDPKPAPPQQAPDRITAFTSLAVPAKQRLNRLLVRAGMGEAGTIAAAGIVDVPNAARVYAIKRVTATAAPGAIVKLRLKLPSKALKAAGKAIRRHRRVRATITIKAKDVAGNVAVQTRTVTLKH